MPSLPLSTMSLAQSDGNQRMSYLSRSSCLVVYVNASCVCDKTEENEAS
jgi:hypothetical protein